MSAIVAIELEWVSEFDRRSGFFSTGLLFQQSRLVLSQDLQNLGHGIIDGVDNTVGCWRHSTLVVWLTILVEVVFLVIWGVFWGCGVPCKARIQEKSCKNHTKSYYIPITHSASFSNHSRDIILWKRQRNCFICNIIAQIPHSDNCQPSKMNKYSESVRMPI